MSTVNDNHAMKHRIYTQKKRQKAKKAKQKSQNGHRRDARCRTKKPIKEQNDNDELIIKGKKNNKTYLYTHKKLMNN